MRSIVGWVLGLVLSGCGGHASVEEACSNLAHCGVMTEAECLTWEAVHYTAGQQLSGDCLDLLAGSCEGITQQSLAGSCLSPCAMGSPAECLADWILASCRKSGEAYYWSLEDCRVRECAEPLNPSCDPSAVPLGRCTCI